MPLFKSKTSSAPSLNGQELSKQPFQLGYDFIVHPNNHTIDMLNGFKVASSLKIEPRVMQVLLALAKAQGEVVHKSHLIEEIWDNYGGADDALMQTISKLRKYLQDDARKQVAIKTIPKKGYILSLPVRSLEKEDLETLRNKQFSPGPRVGAFTGFVERLTQPKFFLAFLFLSLVVLFFLAELSYLVFWMG